MSISDWSSDVCSSDLALQNRTYVHRSARLAGDASGQISFGQNSIGAGSQSTELDHTLLTAPCRDLTIHKLPFAHLQLAPLILHNEGLRACYGGRSEEHTSELQSLMRISYAVFCLKKKHQTNIIIQINMTQNIK